MRIERLIPLCVMLLAGSATAEPLTLQLPGNSSLSVDAPPMTRLKETSEGDRYQYVASSIDHADKRFNLSVFVDPITCYFGTSLKEVTRCFLEKSDLIPGMVKESRSTHCDEQRCEVVYVTGVKLNDRMVVQMHTNTILVYGNRWIDIHLSVVSPTDDDKRIFARLADSLSHQVPAN